MGSESRGARLRRAAASLLFGAGIFGCAAAPPDVHPEYGYTPDRPIQVGGGAERGAARELAYLDTLRGPRGETVFYRRAGSCCAEEPPDGIAATIIGELHLYNVSYRGMKGYRTLYFDMYEYEDPRAPAGFILLGELDP